MTILTTLSLLCVCNGFSLPSRLAASSKLQASIMQIDLEELRQALPDPFRYSKDLEHFFMLPKAQALTRNGRKSAEALLLYIRHCTEPDLVRVAVLLLSRLDPDHFYPELLTLIATANREAVEAMEPGLWRVSVDPEALASDLIAMVTPERPYPLLLLQHSAVRTVKSRLIDLVRRDIHPMSTYAMYCLRYVLDSGDRPFIVSLEKGSHILEICDLAREYLGEIAAGRL